jgi:hypothetical protein
MFPITRNERNYRRRDFAFALAMSANGEATVIRTSAKTNPKPNMLSRFLPIQRETGQGWAAATTLAIARLQNGNTQKVAKRRMGEPDVSQYGGFGC